MSKHKGLLAVAAMAALTLGTASHSRAEDMAPTLDQPAYLAAGGKAYKPLMNVLGGSDSFLAKAGLDLGGYVEGSFTHNFDHAGPIDHPRELNNTRLFDFENNVLRLNQVDLHLSRDIGFSKDKFDVGFRVETIFGSDSRFLQANGIDPYGGVSGFLTPTTSYQSDPINQLALYQAYVDFNLPVGNGVNVRVGKFASFFGSAVDPTQNSLYSHTIAFGFFRPLTLTGVLVSAKIGDNVIVEGGFSRGWDQASKDNNDAIDGFARVIWAIDDKTSFSLAGITGPEGANDNDNYSTVIEALLKYRASDQLRFALDATLGRVDGAGVGVANFSTGTVDILTTDVKYYGLTGYAGYTLDPHITLNARAEAFNVSNSRFLLGQTSSSANLLSLTVGTTITPMPDDPYLKYLKIRPEVRFDWASENIFRALNSNNQITFGIDVLYQF